MCYFNLLKISIYYAHFRPMAQFQMNILQYQWDQINTEHIIKGKKHSLGFIQHRMRHLAY